MIDRNNGSASGAVLSGTSIPVRKKRTQLAPNRGCKGSPVEHGLRTWDSHHPNACRNLVRDPLSAEECDQLKTCQKQHAATVGTEPEGPPAPQKPKRDFMDQDGCRSPCADGMRPGSQESF